MNPFQPVNQENEKDFEKIYEENYDEGALI